MVQCHAHSHLHSHENIVEGERKGGFESRRGEGQRWLKDKGLSVSGGLSGHLNLSLAQSIVDNALSLYAILVLVLNYAERCTTAAQNDRAFLSVLLLSHG